SVRTDRERAPSLMRKVFAGAVQCALVLAIAFAAYKTSLWLTETAPKAERTARERVARLVEVSTVRAAEQGPVIEAWGEVQPARTLVVRPEITGTITWVHPDVRMGGRLKQGDVAARFDDRYLSLAVSRAEADIAEIEARILIEQGQGEIGRRELTRLSRNLTASQRNLVLRVPQMAQLEAELASARSTLQQARIALSKTEVIVPFDGVITSESVAPGAVLSQGTEAATFVASDVFEVVLAVPASALEWIDPNEGQLLAISQDNVWQENSQRTGQLVRLSSELSETGRMVELIAEVPDPLALKEVNEGKPPLLLGSFVRVTIEGRRIDGAVSLDRALLRDNDTVWIMQTDDTLDIRTVDIAWRGADKVLVRSGLSTGERVVTTPLSTVAPGMALRTRTEEVSG
ncbi:MAG: efflux RND transporter periplasmic adaptor subunit, partial [Pseudomonadota bacterium]